MAVSWPGRNASWPKSAWREPSKSISAVHSEPTVRGQSHSKGRWTSESLSPFGAKFAGKSRLMSIRTFRFPRKSSIRIVEPLENRIAPAAFFLSGADLVIRDSSGAPVTDGNLFGADAAVLLKKGDQLF